MERLVKAVYRLKSSREFAHTYRNGKSAACKSLVLVYVRTGSDRLKAGFSVSKKIGKSVVRNKVKRRLREAFSKLIPQLRQDYYYVFIARKGIVEDDYKAIADSVSYLLKKANLFFK
jgi:ribonuclease P protein component